VRIIRIRNFIVVLAIGATFTLIGCGRTYSAQIFAMGTFFDIRLFDGSQANLTSIRNEIEEMDRLFDAHENRGNGGLWHLNNHFYVPEGSNATRPTEFLEVDSRLIEIIELGLKYEELTNGYFNIALGRVVNRWKQVIQGEAAFPTDEELESLRESTLSSNIEFSHGNRIRLLNNVQIDLGSIAKGYAALRIKEYLGRNNVRRFLINAGTSTITLGSYVDGSRFNVSIRNPLRLGEFLTRISLQDISISTSADNIQYLEIGNRRYHHIINPFTLRPEQIFHSVSVISDNPLLTDIISTALFSMSLEAGLELHAQLAEIYSLEVLWFGTNQLLTRTDGFRSYET